MLNGRRDVAPKTREAVLKAVQENGFAMNRNARALSGGRIAGMRSWTGAIMSFADVVMIAKVRRRSPVFLSFHVSYTPARE